MLVSLVNTNTKSVMEYKVVHLNVFCLLLYVRIFKPFRVCLSCHISISIVFSYQTTYTYLPPLGFGGIFENFDM